MKTLELNLQKRLLIVEVGEIEEIIDVQPDFNTALLQGKKFIAVKGNHKLICKGSELTEDIAKGLVKSPENFQFLDAENTFIGEIEKHGYYWGENPIQSTVPTSDLNFYDNIEVYHHCLKVWQEAESKTFKPDKSLIFEIIL